MLLGLGLACLILAFPVGESADKGTWLQAGNMTAQIGMGGDAETGVEAGQVRTGQAYEQQPDVHVSASAKTTLTYEQQLEERLEELLSHVEGVGTVEVMIVLKTSEEKIWQVDQDTSYSATQETDQNGGSRRIENQDISQDTILTGQSGQEGPLLQKEIRPEIGGVVISAQGGGSPTIRAEISSAVEALFDVPSHKIKVLKRVE